MHGGEDSLHGKRVGAFAFKSSTAFQGRRSIFCHGDERRKLRRLVDGFAISRVQFAITGIT